MFEPTSVSEKLLFSTVKLIVQKAGGITATGTAFFFDVPFGEGKSIPLIVTNKHVVAGGIIGEFLLHESETKDGRDIPSGRTLMVRLASFEGRWTMHPTASIDLCAMPMAAIHQNASAVGKTIYSRTLAPDIIPDEQALSQLFAVEDILMIGYPVGLSDDKNNLPLVRRGITASHPAVDYQGRSEGVVDAACFPGSSGSPIVVLNEGHYQTRQGSVVGGSRLLLLGALYGGPKMTADGKIQVRNIPTSQELYTATDLMIHLGYYVKAREILVLAEIFRAHAKAAQGA